MASVRPARRRRLALVCAAAALAAGLVVVPTASALTRSAPGLLAAAGHDTLVSTVPQAATPDVQDESTTTAKERVDTIHDAGQKVIAGGNFLRVRNPDSPADISRPYLFAFDETTGEVDTAFAPVVNDEVTAIVAGPAPGTAFIGGRFTHVNGVSRPKIALVNVADGSLVSTFAGPSGIDGAVMDLAPAGGRLLVGGSFKKIRYGPAAVSDRGGLASFDATTGALDGFLTTALTVNHNWTPDSPPDHPKAPVGADKLAVSPDGSQLVVVGNFKRADGAAHDQVVKLDLAGAAATVADWNTDRYAPPCARQAFDSYVRDVAYAPDGSHFVIVSSGGGFPGTLCDNAARWEARATGGAQEPTWTNATGADTLLSVAVSEQAVYVGGHQRWMNNPLGSNGAGAGAVARPGIAALDPASGLPLAWNPGRHPRGFGTTELLVTPQGLWLGHDQEWIGNFQHHHERIAFFPLAGGAAPHSTATRALPGNVYQFGQDRPATVLYRVNAGGGAVAANDGGPTWTADTAAAPSPRHNAGTSATTGLPPIAAVKAPPFNHGTTREIFSSERRGNATAPNLLWDFPVPRGTAVQVRLYLAQRCACAVGFRTFNITVDGVRKATNYDLAAAVGNEVGTVLTYNVRSDGNVDVDLTRVADFPVVSAVELVRVPPPAPTGRENKTWIRTYDGSGRPSAATELALGTTAWSAARGGFWVGGTLFYGADGALHRRAFDGAGLGAATRVDPYHDPRWDGVLTDSRPEGQTYRGAPADFYAEIAGVTGMFYRRGRLYYTIAGHSALYWRGFTPDSGTVGATRFAISGPVSFAGSGGVFVSGASLYLVGRGNGTLSRLDWVDERPTGTPAVVSGPAVDGQDWRAKLVFVGP